MKYSEKVSNKLNELLEKTYDAEKGYQLAQDKVENASLKTFFGDRVQQRYLFGRELKNEISNFGQLAEKGGSVQGDLHRTWINLTSTLSANEEEKLLEEVVRGEKASIATYNEVLLDDNVQLPESTTQLLNRQRDLIQLSLEDVKRFETILS